MNSPQGCTSEGLMLDFYIYGFILMDLRSKIFTVWSVFVCIIAQTHKLIQGASKVCCQSEFPLVSVLFNEPLGDHSLMTHILPVFFFLCVCVGGGVRPP